MRLRVLILMAVLALQGCHTLHVAKGQMELVAQRAPIERLLADPAIPDPLRARLELVEDVRAFAHGELGLPDNGSYRHYADLGRPFVLWNVVVTEEFSLEPMRWCAPVAGCVAYRGWFDRAAAERFAERHRSRGRDVSVGGVRAYSTLGWFRDPVLNTMFSDDDHEFAAILFHELAHQWLYVAGDSAFSEAFAVVVEREGVRRWLRTRDDADALGAYEARHRRRMEFLAALDEARSALQALYALELPAEELRARKQAEFEALRVRLGEERLRNNADLAASATYHALVPELERLLEEVGGDLDAFRRRAEVFSEDAR